MKIFWLSFLGSKFRRRSHAENFECISKWADSPGLRPPTDYVRDGSTLTTSENRSSRRFPSLEANNRK
jgi:hypothetical protein